MKQQVNIKLDLNLWLDASLHIEEIGVLIRNNIYSAFESELLPILPEKRLNIIAMTIKEEREIY